MASKEMSCENVDDGRRRRMTAYTILLFPICLGQLLKVVHEGK